MTSTDPIGDMFSRIRNASKVNKTEVVLPHSRTKETVANILVANSFLKSVRSEDISGRKTLRIVIADTDRKSPITEIERLSRPGRRTYVKVSRIPAVKRGRGMVIISTSKGIMSGQEARQQGLGGELIGKVY